MKTESDHKLKNKKNMLQDKRRELVSTVCVGRTAAVFENQVRPGGVCWTPSFLKEGRMKERKDEKQEGEKEL